MTEENYNYRTSPFLLRNQFDGKSSGAFKIPEIPKTSFKDEDFENLLLLGFDRTNLENTNHLDRIVHFFLYDYKFERVWKNPDTDIEKLKRYKAVLSPDFSMYREMNPAMQLYNTFRNRWCGAYFASKGIKVIPTVSWGDESTFEFCFSGIEIGSTVAVSTYMVSEHNNHSDQKDFFLKGYNEMLRKIRPERIICYNNPFPEMQGNIVFVDYELSSWKYQNDDYTSPKYSKNFCGYVCGDLQQTKDCHPVIKRGWVTSFDEEKGMGSAYGGKWKPKKPDDERYIGKPGEVIKTFSRNGEKRLTKIGDDGFAIKERHFSVHSHPNTHTNPHDHEISWDNNYPDPGKPINYPDGAPDFKYYSIKENYMNKSINYDFLDNSLDFQTISDFKWCMKCGGEVEFVWKEKSYCVFGKLQKAPDSQIQMCIGEANKPSTDKWADTADEILEYIVGGDRLRDVITKVKVIDRTI